MTPSETRKNAWRTLAFVLALVLALLGPGCITEPDTVDNDSTNVLIQIVQMLGQSEDAQGPGEEVSDLFSDVCFNDGTFVGCSVFNDNGVVSMRAVLKDRAQLASNIDDVVFERYRVTYIRADGRNVPGVDVPYPFDGVANFRVAFDGSTAARSFIVVRHQAKNESPLRELQSNLAGILSVIAQIDFYGHDTAGRSIQVTGYLNISFADFAN